MLVADCDLVCFHLGVSFAKLGDYVQEQNVVVGLHLVAGGNLTGEHAAERKEAALVGGGDHLGHVHHEGALGVAIHHGLGVLVIERALVQSCITVLLGRCRGGQVVDHHLQKTLVS